MIGYETFSTTADVGIRIQGENYEMLYRNAVNGLNLLCFQQNPIPSGPIENIPFRFNGDSGENVLVNLLAEVIFLLQCKGLVTQEITFITADEKNIDALLRMVPLAAEPEIELKSVTYHNLKLFAVKGMICAEVVFDV